MIGIFTALAVSKLALAVGGAALGGAALGGTTVGIISSKNKKAALKKAEEQLSEATEVVEAAEETSEGTEPVSEAVEVTEATPVVAEVVEAPVATVEAIKAEATEADVTPVVEVKAESPVSDTVVTPAVDDKIIDSVTKAADEIINETIAANPNANIDQLKSEVIAAAAEVAVDMAAEKKVEEKPKSRMFDFSIKPSNTLVAEEVSVAPVAVPEQIQVQQPSPATIVAGKEDLRNTEEPVSTTAAVSAADVPNAVADATSSAVPSSFTAGPVPTATDNGNTAKPSIPISKRKRKRH